MASPQEKGGPCHTVTRLTILQSPIIVDTVSQIIFSRSPSSPESPLIMALCQFINISNCSSSHFTPVFIQSIHQSIHPPITSRSIELFPTDNRTILDNRRLCHVPSYTFMLHSYLVPRSQLAPRSSCVESSYRH